MRSECDLEKRVAFVFRLISNARTHTHTHSGNKSYAFFFTVEDAKFSFGYSLPPEKKDFDPKLCGVCSKKR